MKSDSKITTHRIDCLVVALVLAACLTFIIVVVGQRLRELEAKLDEIASDVGIYIGDNKDSEASRNIGIYIGGGWDCVIATEEYGCMVVDDKGYVMFVEHSLDEEHQVIYLPPEVPELQEELQRGVSWEDYRHLLDPSLVAKVEAAWSRGEEVQVRVPQ